MTEPITSEMEAMLLFRKHKRTDPIAKAQAFVLAGRPLDFYIRRRMYNRGLIVLRGASTFDCHYAIAPRFDIGGETATV